MATKIYNTETGEVHNLELINRESGQDFLSDVIGGCNQSDEWLNGIPEHRDDVDYAMSAEEVAWWERWASREQRINDIYNASDKGMKAKISATYADYDWDMWLPQDKVFELLGFED